MTIFEALREDHDTQRTLADLLVQTHGDSEGREELFGRFKTALQKHAAAEERHFYIPLMEHDLTQETARHSIAEHHEIDELIAELEGLDFSAPHWLGSARKLTELVTHHLAEEEQGVFQRAGRVLSESQKASLAQSYRQEMKA